MRKSKTKILKGARASIWREDSGIGLLELVIVVAVIAIVSAFAVMGVTRARAAVRLQNSARLLAGNVEKARIYAIRRHRSARVEFTSDNTYTLTMDFGGTGNDDAVRSYRLDGDVIITNADGTPISTANLPLIDFDWRGRTTQCFTNIRMQNINGESSRLSVSNSGDITVNSNLGETISPGSYSSVNQTSDVAPDTTVSGSSPAPNINPCSGGTALPGATPSPSTSSSSTPPSGCSVFNVNNTAVTVSRNGGSTGSFIVRTTTSADTINVIQTDGRTNLQFSPAASQTVAANSSITFTVASRNNSRGQFPIKFISACNSSNIVSATVTVTN